MLQFTKEFWMNLVLFVFACIVLGLSIWALTLPCKKNDPFGDYSPSPTPNSCGYCDKNCPKAGEAVSSVTSLKDLNKMCKNLKLNCDKNLGKIYVDTNWACNNIGSQADIHYINYSPSPTPYPLCRKINYNTWLKSSNPAAISICPNSKCDNNVKLRPWGFNIYQLNLIPAYLATHPHALIKSVIPFSKVPSGGYKINNKVITPHIFEKILKIRENCKPGMDLFVIKPICYTDLTKGWEVVNMLQPHHSPSPSPLSL